MASSKLLYLSGSQFPQPNSLSEWLLSTHVVQGIVGLCGRDKLIGEFRPSGSLQLSREDKTHTEIPGVVSYTSSLHPPPSEGG